MVSQFKQNSLFSNLMVKESATLTWTIDNFAQVGEVKSPYFSPINSEHKFSLELNTKMYSFDLNRLLLELWYNQHQKQVLLCYRISILDANGQKHYTNEYLWQYQEQDRGLCEFNVTSYITRLECIQLLVNGSLKIYCEVDILGEKTGQLSPQQAESSSKLVADLETLLENCKLTDFIVQIGDKKKFKVHKNILAARSPVFAAMFDHDDVTKEGEEGRVVIEDVEVEVFEHLIRYIYTGKVERLDEYAAELFVVADKYQLDHLKTICEQSLLSSIATESVAAVLLIADMHKAEQLKLKCIEYIVDNWKEVKETKCWKDEIKDKRADLIEQILDCRY